MTEEELSRSERKISTTLQSKEGVIKDHDDLRVQSTLNTAEYRDFEELTDNHFMNEAEAARKLITLGMHAFIEHDPQNKKSTDDAVTIREYIPEGKDNAIDLREELIENIEDDLLTIISDDPEVNLDGWKVYR